MFNFKYPSFIRLTMYIEQKNVPMITSKKNLNRNENMEQFKKEECIRKGTR